MNTLREGSTDFSFQNPQTQILKPHGLEDIAVTNKQNKGGVSLCGLAIYIKKYLKAKEQLWKFKYFTMKKYNLKKNPLKETKILQDINTL